jgi:hypothetical protein
VIGRLVRWSKGKTAYGKKWIAILETEDAAGGQPSSLVSVWLLHKVLKEEMEKLEPKIGERIGIRRLEDGKNGNGKCYRYKVIVDRKPEAELQPDWNTLAEGGLPENAEPRTADPGAASAEDESDIPW